MFKYMWLHLILWDYKVMCNQHFQIYVNTYRNSVTVYIPADTHRALQAVERLQAKLRERGDTANEEKLSLLKSVLQSPLFNQILNLQASLPQSRDQVGQ